MTIRTRLERLEAAARKAHPEPIEIVILWDDNEGLPGEGTLAAGANIVIRWDDCEERPKIDS